MIIKIAWKNIWRNKLRSSVVILAVIIGLVGGIFVASLMKGMTNTRIKNAIENEVSDIQIHNSKFLDNEETKFNIENADQLIAELKQHENVKSLTSRKKIQGMASSPETGIGISIVGINPDEEKQTTAIFSTLCDSCGTYFAEGKKNRVLISQKTADKLKVKLKQKIVLSFQDANGDFTGGAFRVVGIFKSKNTMFDERYLYVQKKDLARLSSFPIDNVNEIAIRLNNPLEYKSLTAEIQSKHADLSVRDWRIIVPELGVMSDLMDAMTYVLMIIILLALGFGIVNTMLMVVLERVRELGMLMAIGMNKKRVFAMIMFETIFLSIVGGIIGMAISGTLNAYFGTYGLKIGGIDEGMEAMGFSSTFYPDISIEFYAVLVLLIITTGIIAAIYPAIKALKLNPAEAVRTDM